MRAETSADFDDWRKRFLSALHDAPGPLSQRPKPKVTVVHTYRLDGYVRQKIVYKVEPTVTVAAWLCEPLGKTPQKRPALLCCHGHGPGKDPLVGFWQGKPCREYHKMVSVRLAQKGFITLTPDRRGYGDNSPFTNGFPQPQRDLGQLDRSYQAQGTSLLARDIQDALYAIDLLAGMKDVDATRLGCLGVEAGGTVAAAVSAVDNRIAAVCLTSILTGQLAFRGKAQLPALAGKAGPLEVCSLIAPRPLMIQIPLADETIAGSCARKAYRRLKKAYVLANGAGSCSHLEFDGIMQLHFPSCLEWFNQWLNPGKRKP